MKEQLKNMFGFTVGAILCGEAIRQVGNIGSGMSDGLKSATQSMIGVGILGSATKMFKW